MTIMVAGTPKMIAIMAPAEDRPALLATLRAIRNLPERRTRNAGGPWGRAGRWF